ncbi:CCC motif membrane protein [Galbibacter orientalis]|uniref:CCC motif membrane protein n=1 Tax=Galbibacter orientalis TaxID=453852 RepID=UPI00300263B6
MEKQRLNPTLHYVLSILGFLCCCFAGLGFIPAGIAFFMANSKIKQAQLNPENYDNVKAMQTAKTVALVVLIINLLYLAVTIYRIATIGWDEIQLQQQEILEQWGIEQ